MRFTASTGFSVLILTRWSAPSLRPSSSRESRVPVRITGCAPSALATATVSSPIAPGPVTTTLCPAIRPPSVSSAYIAVPAVTISVASSSPMPSGTCTRVLTLFTAYSAKPPSVVKPLARWPLLCVAVVHAVVEAGRVHAGAASFAASAAEMHFDRDPIADRVLVHPGAELDDGAHVFVARREVLVERQPALDQAPAARA